MSPAVVHDGRVFLSGQVAQDNAGGSIAEQTEEILERIDRLLAEAGSDKSRLLTAQVWIREMAHYDAMSAVWDACHR